MRSTVGGWPGAPRRRARSATRKRPDGRARLVVATLAVGSIVSAILVAGASPAAAASPAEQAAVTWANNQVGTNEYGYACLSFVRQAWAEGGVALKSEVSVSWGSNTYPDDLWGHFTAGTTGSGEPSTPGALIFYSAGSGGDAGSEPSHVQIFVGNNTVVSSEDAFGTDVHTEPFGKHPRELGWWLPDATSGGGGDPNSPIGSYDSVSSPAPGEIEVGGWAFDPNAPTTPVEIDVYVGAPAGAAGSQGFDTGDTDVPRPDVQAAYPQAGPDTGYDATIDLTAAGSYPVYVYADNIGAGTNTLLGSKAVVVAAPTVPDAPTGVAAVPGAGSAVVSWTAPSNDGGAVITGYSVTAAPGGATCSSAALSCTVAGLADGTAYSFTVLASNAVGDSAPSDPSTSVVPADRPSAPSRVTASAGDQNATVSWTAPAANGSPITTYTVTATDTTSAGSGGQSVVVSGNPPDLTATVTELIGGDPYTFAVTATNGVGVSSASAPSAAVTPTPENPKPSPTLTPTIRMRAPSRVHGRKTEITLSCVYGACYGRVSLVRVRTVHRHGQVHTVYSGLGSAHYSLSADRTGMVRITISKKAKSLLAHARDHRIDIWESATVIGGEEKTRPVQLRE
jgi:hypothetical protein